MNFYKFCLLLETEKKNYLSKSFGFKEWFFLVEGFKSKEQLQQLVSKFVKLSPEYNEETVRYYLQVLKALIEKNTPRIRDNIEGVTIDINKRYDISAYQTFEEIKNTVDYVSRYVDITKLQFSDLNREKFYSIFSMDDTELKSDSSKMIYSDNKIQIFYAATKQACIKQKDRPEYSWCISASREGQNMYNSYRYKDYQPTFYFVKNIEKTNNEFELLSTAKRTSGVFTSGKVGFKDKYHFFVIQAIKGVDKKDPSKAQYIVTSAKNDGDIMMSWKEIVEIEPLLNGKQELFEHYPLTEQEMKFYEKYKYGITDEKFAELPVKDKEMYLDVFVDFHKKLSDYQFASLNDDLKNKYINFGLGLANYQYDLIKENNKLNKRYNQVTIEKIKILLKQDNNLELMDSEWEIFFNNANQFDLSKLDSKNVFELLRNSPNPIEVVQILGKEKIEEIFKNLDSKDVYELLRYSKNQVEMIKILGKKNINRLEHYGFADLLRRSSNPLEMAQIFGKEKTKELIDKLSSYDVYYLLRDSSKPLEMAEILESNNINKLNFEEVYNLLITSEKPLEMAQALGTDNIKKLDFSQFYELLNYSKNQIEMAQILGSENIKKLNFKQIYYLLGNSPNPIELAKFFEPEKVEEIFKNLNSKDVFELLRNSKNPNELAKFFEPEKVEEIFKNLDSKDVYDLLYHSSKPLEMAQFLGSENIKKLDQIQIEELLYDSKNPEEMKKLFNNIYNT